MKKKKITIVIFWLVFLLVAGSLLNIFEYNAYSRKAAQNMVEQTDILASEIRELLKVDGLAQVELYSMRAARLNSFLLTMENVVTLNRAKYLAQKFYDVADIKSLSLVDANGRILYTVGESSYDSFDKDFLAAMDSGDYDKQGEIDSLMNNLEGIEEFLISSEMSGFEDESFLMVTNCGQWIVTIEYDFSEEEKNALNYFRWPNALQRIKLQDGCRILVLDENDGTILSHPDKEKIGQGFDILSVQAEGSQNALSLEDLKNLFPDNTRIVKVSIEGKSYYALRMDVDHCIMLALLPVDEIQNETFGNSSTWMFLLILITGICMLFSLFYLQEENEIIVEGKHGFNYNKSLAGRLGVCAVLATLSMFVLGLFVHVLSVNAETITYNQKMAAEIASVRSEETAVRDKLEEIYREDELIKAKIAGFVLANKKESDITADFMDKLAKSLDVKYCSYYDLKGNLIVSNSPYGTELDPDSEFYNLLKGREEYSEGFSIDATVGESRQKAGVSVLDRNAKCKGALVLEEDAERRNSILDTLDYDLLLREVKLKDDTSLLILPAEEKNILYFSTIQDGKPYSLLDNKVTIDDIKFDDNKLRDNGNITISVLGRKYSAAIKLASEQFILVMRDQNLLNWSSLLTVLLEMAAVVAFILLLWPLACFRNKKDETLKQKEEAVETLQISDIEAAEVIHGKKNEVLAVLSGIANNNKPYFEERWAKDSTRWKDKTAYQKFSSSFVLVCFLAILFNVVQAFILKENSIWYHCVLGEWDKGINIHSITFCAITIIILFYVKILIHKLLYLTARASSARGETICHLFDSFLAFIMYIAGILLCLANFGVDLRILGVTGSVAGLILSVSCQNILADMLSGILMAVEGTVRAGDFVTFEGNPGIVYSIGIRTTKLKWYGQITAVRNNDFKNYVSFGTDRVKAFLNLDYRESLSRFEDIFEEESSYLHDKLCEYADEYIDGPYYIGVEEVGDNGILVCFSFICRGEKIYALQRMLNRELIFMCERHNILLALPQIVVNEPDEKVIYEKTEVNVTNKKK